MLTGLFNTESVNELVISNSFQLERVTIDV